MTPQASAGSLVRPGRWSRITVHVANRGDRSAPRGRLRAGGRSVRGRATRVPALAPGRSVALRVAVRVQRRPARYRMVRLVCDVGGQRQVATVQVRVARR